MILNLKNWFYFSAAIATLSILYFGLNIPLEFFDGRNGFEFYHFIIYGLIIFPYLLIFLIKQSKKKKFPNYFLWFVTFICAGAYTLFLFVYSLYFIIFGPCGDGFCIFGFVFLIPTILAFSIALALYLKSNKLC